MGRSFREGNGGSTPPLAPIQIRKSKKKEVFMTIKKKYFVSVIKVAESLIDESGSKTSPTMEDYMRTAVVYGVVMAALLPLVYYLGMYCSY